MVFARGVVTTILIPQALAEFSRVLKPDGKLWLSLHRWKDCKFILQGGWSEHRVKTLALGAYVIGNSICFHCSGKMFRYPLNRSRTVSFQTPQRMRKELHKAGFTKVKFSYGKYLVVEATKLSYFVSTIPQPIVSKSTPDDLKMAA
jgi:ubiquinone/menaquinone biosynthesis C-methylase UbiE